MENEAWLSALMTSTQHCTEDLEQYHMLKNEIKEIKIGKEELKKIICRQSGFLNIKESTEKLLFDMF